VTVFVTALYVIAERVGTNRIMRAGGKFHYPFGNPELPHELEVKWRRKMTEAALIALTRRVEKPTVFTPEELLAH